VADKRLVEVACIITEADLTEVASYGPVVIGQPAEVLANMSDWCKKTFKKNGLLEKINQSQMTEEKVEKEVVCFIKILFCLILDARVFAATHALL
jgi:oligoribonuclease